MSVHELYEGLISARKLERDPAQERLLDRFVALEQRVAAHRSARRTKPLGWLFGNGGQNGPVKGLYIHGEVGRGKTMLMDLFFEASPVVRKRRAHFHEFMGDVHERVRVLRQRLKDGEIEGDDATALAMTATVRPNNYTQILTKAVVVSGTASAVNTAGRKDELA